MTPASPIPAPKTVPVVCPLDGHAFEPVVPSRSGLTLRLWCPRCEHKWSVTVELITEREATGFRWCSLRWTPIKDHMVRP